MTCFRIRINTVAKLVLKLYAFKGKGNKNLYF